jgi:hypothetical protein
LSVISIKIFLLKICQFIKDISRQKPFSVFG